MRVLIRCDGASRIGMGHVIRSAALADAIRAHGAEVHFAMRADRPQGVEAVLRLGFTVCEIRDDQEFVASSSAYDVALVDSYEVATETLESAAAHTFLAVVDDGERLNLPAVSWLLNQNIGAEGLLYRTPPTAVKLFGPRYALLRAEFAVERAILRREFHEADSRVLITFGGGDVARLRDTVLHALESVERRLEIVLLGCTSTRIRSRHEVRCVQVSAGVATTMAQADVAVTAAGSTCWELCCMQVPALVAPIVENQHVVAAGLQKAGAAHVYAGFEDLAACVAQDIEMLLNDPLRRSELAQCAGDLVDGAGAGRAAQALVRITAEP